MLMMVFLLMSWQLMASTHEDGKPLTRKEVVELAAPLTVHNALNRLSCINKLVQIHKVNGDNLKKECLEFIQNNNVKMCFEAKDPETGKLFSDFHSYDRINSYKRGLHRLEILVNKINSTENTKITHSDEQLTSYVFLRRDLAVIRLPFIITGIFAMTMLSAGVISNLGNY